MKQQPNFLKYNKKHKKRFFINRLDYRSNSLKYGYYGLKSKGFGLVTFKQLEAGRKAINRLLKRTGKIWIRLFPCTPFTSKPVATRMGKGKGSVTSYAIFVKPGTIIYEINNVGDLLAREVLKKASLKMPMGSAIVKREL